MFFQKRPHENSDPNGYIKSLKLHTYLIYKFNKMDDDIVHLFKSGCGYNFISTNEMYEMNYKILYLTMKMQIESLRSKEFDFMSECENLSTIQILQKYAYS